jgi:Tfp pilus assembly protein PilE
MSENNAITGSKPKLNMVFSNLELVIVVLLGLVSIVTAYASFQAALYDSQMAGSYAKGSNLSTEAESLYLEANQQFLQDTQVLNRLSELAIEANSTNETLAVDASAKIDELTFMAVSDEFSAAIAWGEAEDISDPEYYHNPQDNEGYQDFLFSGWSDKKAEAQRMIAEGDVFNSLSDRLTLNTVLMAISLFLLGVAAVVRQLRMQAVLLGTGLAIFAVAAVLTVSIPFVGL